MIFSTEARTNKKVGVLKRIIGQKSENSMRNFGRIGLAFLAIFLVSFNFLN